MRCNKCKKDQNNIMIVSNVVISQTNSKQNFLDASFINYSWKLSKIWRTGFNITQFCMIVNLCPINSEISSKKIPSLGVVEGVVEVALKRVKLSG